MQDIPKGSLVWKYGAGVNSITLNNKEEVSAYLDSMPSDNARKLILEYAYCWQGRVNVLTDHTNFINHAEEGIANIGMREDLDIESTYALRDIKKGEEWFEDYGDWEFPAWYLSICKKYGADFSFVMNGPKSLKWWWDKILKIVKQENKFR